MLFLIEIWSLIFNLILTGFRFIKSNTFFKYLRKNVQAIGTPNLLRRYAGVILVRGSILFYGIIRITLQLIAAIVPSRIFLLAPIHVNAIPLAIGMPPFDISLSSRSPFIQAMICQQGKIVISFPSASTFRLRLSPFFPFLAICKRQAPSALQTC